MFLCFVLTGFRGVEALVAANTVDTTEVAGTEKTNKATSVKEKPTAGDAKNIDDISLTGMNLAHQHYSSCELKPNWLVTRRWFPLGQSMTTCRHGGSI